MKMSIGLRSRRAGVELAQPQPAALHVDQGVLRQHVDAVGVELGPVPDGMHLHGREPPNDLGQQALPVG